MNFMWNNKKLPPIGNVQPENPFFLAPMAGITDAVFRRICTEMGAGMTYSEMVSAKGLYYGDKKTDELLFCYPEERHAALQIFGHEPDIMAFAAEKLDGRPNDILDINMGCPVPKVFKNGDGSAMMKKPEQIEAVVRAAAAHTRKPVSVKIRLGVSDSSRNAVECALAAEKGGAAAVAVHGRTREQYYSGSADWKAIAEVRDALHIPVIANGDVQDAESAKLEPFKREVGENKARQLLDTLETFVLDAGMNSSKTSVFMGIHTNTVQYRLKRINEVLGAEITGNRVIPGLTIALALKRLSRVVK